MMMSSATRSRTRVAVRTSGLATSPSGSLLLRPMPERETQIHVLHSTPNQKRPLVVTFLAATANVRMPADVE
eukprot:2235938-Alexandrium_andersonii.AAC.1